MSEFAGLGAAQERYENIEVDVRGSVALVRLARPSKLNPLDWATIKELRRVVGGIEAEASITVAVITGSGRSFSAGGDLDAYFRLYQVPEDFSAFLEDFGLLLEAIEESRIIYVAAVNGLCVAGGLELLLACDLVLASDRARIGDGHLNYGQLPGAGGSQRLPRAIGALRAKHLILTGDMVDAAAAQSMGLVNLIFPHETFDDEVMNVVEKLLSKSRSGLSGAKRLVNYAASHPLKNGLRHERDFVHEYATSHPDAIEGLMAFREKRNPKFKM